MSEIESEEEENPEYEEEEEEEEEPRQMSKTRKFIKDGVFYAELNDFLANELAEEGYAGCEVRVTPTRTEVIIRATRPRQVVGEQGRLIREITALVQQRFKYKKGQIILFAEKIRNKGLSALAQAQAVKFRLMQGLSVRRAAYSVVKFIMDKGAKGCEVVVSGKLRGQRAKAMKFRDGYMIHAGNATTYYVEKAVKHVHLRQGVIGIKVKIMLPYDPTGENGVPVDLPDAVKIPDPDKVEIFEQNAPYQPNVIEPAYMQQQQQQPDPMQSGMQPMAPSQPEMQQMDDSPSQPDMGGMAQPQSFQPPPQQQQPPFTGYNPYPQ